MKNKNIAKKLGVIVLAFGLAVSGAAPSAGTAVRAAQEADSTVKTKGFSISKKTYQHDFKYKNGKIYKEVSFEYPAAAGKSEAAEKFNQYYQNLLKKWKKQVREDLAEAKDIVKQRDDDIHYGDRVTCTVTSNDENYISIMEEGYVYTLGAHGMPYRYTNIFDTKTGKEVSAARLLDMSKEQLNTKIRSLYLRKYDKTKGESFLGTRADVKKTLNKIDFNDGRYYIKNGKLRFYAEPYALGPYAAGFIEVTVKL